MSTTIRREVIYLNEQSCNCKMTIIITPTIRATDGNLSKGCILVCVWSESLQRLIALEVSSRGQRLRGAITTKQGTITLSYLNVAYNVDRAGRQPGARYLRLRVSLARTDCRITSYVLNELFGLFM